ncbi:MAG: phosphopantetheine-binding protein [Spirochaetaceae bacterium]|jgi:acyl carrier protein|nr:phosphopantetheine-binding protein [Spirochaetaceae bacterium]
MKTIDLEKFLTRFAELFDETDAGEFKADTPFHTLDEWSSLLGLAVIAMIDAEYGVRVSGEDIKNSKTIEDLFNIVKERV